MKKILAIACCLIIGTLGVMLTGCGAGGASDDGLYSDNPYTGTWKATYAEYKGQQIDLNELYENGFEITLNGDGSSSICLNGGDSQAGTWEPVENGVQLSGDNEMIMETDGDGLVIDYDSVSIHFEK